MLEYYYPLTFAGVIDRQWHGAPVPERSKELNWQVYCDISMSGTCLVAMVRSDACEDEPVARILFPDSAERAARAGNHLTAQRLF